MASLLTLDAHAQRGLQYSVCVSVSVSDTTLQASVVKETLKFRRYVQKPILATFWLHVYCNFWQFANFGNLLHTGFPVGDVNQ